MDARRQFFRCRDALRELVELLLLRQKRVAEALRLHESPCVATGKRSQRRVCPSFSARYSHFGELGAQSSYATHELDDVERRRRPAPFGFYFLQAAQ